MEAIQINNSNGQISSFCDDGGILIAITEYGYSEDLNTSQSLTKEQARTLGEWLIKSSEEQ